MAPVETPRDPSAPEEQAEDASTSSSAPAPQPAPRSPYAKMSEPTTVRNVVWALSLTMGVVIIVALLFFGVGRDLGREVPENSRVDVAASAERAQRIAPFTIAVPTTAEGWSATAARYDDGADPRWTIRYTAPSRSLVTLTEATQVTPALIQGLVPGARGEGTVDVGGATCEIYVESETDEGTPARALACPLDGAAVVVHGDVEQAELSALAGPAVEAARG